MAAKNNALIASKMDGSIRLLTEKLYLRDDVKPTFTEDEWLRASSIPYICPRAHVYFHRLKTERKDTVRPDLLLTFLHGTSLHWGLQNRLLPELKVLLGAWRCRLCGKLHGGLSPADNALLHRFHEEMPKAELTGEREEAFREVLKKQADSVILRPEACSECGFEPEDEYSNFEYEEMWFGVPELRIGGHPDGFLKVPWREDLGLLEVKSISDHGAFKVRDRPDIKHLAQAHVYLLATGLQWVCILYWAKGTFGTKCLVEHYVDRDETLIARMRKALTSLWDGVGGGELPERVCKSIRAPRAKECEVKRVCFDCPKKKEEEVVF